MALTVGGLSFLATVPASAQETITYTYDARSRLVKVDHGSVGPNAGTIANYGYDNAGNRTNVTVTTPSSGGTSCSGVSFGISNDPSANEGSNLSFTVAKTGATSDTCSISYATADGTAIAGTNYTSKPLATLSFAPADTSKSVAVVTIDDGLVTADLAMSLNLSAPVGAATISDAQGIGTIHNTDVTPDCSGVSFTIASNGGVTEGATSTFTVTKAGSTGSSCSVDYATADGNATAPADYAAATGTLTFSSGQATKTISILTIDDSVVESPETYSMTLLGASAGGTIGTPSSASATINDNDTPAVSFSVAAINGGSATEGSPISFMITKTGSTSLTLSVSYSTYNDFAVAPGDYVAKSGTLSFTPTDTSKIVSITTKTDSLTESDEDFGFQISNPTGGATLGTSNAYGVIIDGSSGGCGLAVQTAPDSGSTTTETTTTNGTNSVSSTDSMQTASPAICG